jgi:hypothetical protein
LLKVLRLKALFGHRLQALVALHLLGARLRVLKILI